MLMVMAWWWSGKQGAGQAREVRGILLAAAVAYVVAIIALPRLAGLDPHATGMLARLQAGDPACASRLTLWGNVLHLIAQKPWLGWGWGNLDYAHFITLYPGARFCDILDNAHNLPLHLAVELGVPVALLVCGMGLWLVLRAQPWREARPNAAIGLVRAGRDFAAQLAGIPAVVRAVSDGVWFERVDAVESRRVKFQKYRCF
jgi:O-antigen ligase